MLSLTQLNAIHLPQLVDSNNLVELHIRRELDPTVFQNSYFPNLRHLVLAQPEITKYKMEGPFINARNTPKLAELTICFGYYIGVSHKVLAYAISGIPTLTNLNLHYGTQPFDIDSTELDTEPVFHRFRPCWNQTTCRPYFLCDHLLKWLPFTTLTSMDLGGCSVTADGLAYIFKKNPALKIIRASWRELIDEEAVMAIGEMEKELKVKVDILARGVELKDLPYM